MRWHTIWLEVIRPPAALRIRTERTNALLEPRTHSGIEHRTWHQKGLLRRRRPRSPDERHHHCGLEILGGHLPWVVEVLLDAG
jgi:hypothetical protein